jgi:hypothetical protein
MLLKECQRALLSQVVGSPLALVEGDEVIGGVGREHQVESGGGLGQEAATQFVAVRGSTRGHGGGCGEGVDCGRGLS